MDVEKTLITLEKSIRENSILISLLAFGTIGLVFSISHTLEREIDKLRNADLFLAREIDKLRNADRAAFLATEQRLKRNEEEIAALKNQVEELRNESRGLPK